MIGPPVPARRISASGRQSLFSRGTNGVSTKKTPIAMISRPAIVSSVCLWSRSVEPRPVALMPSATNISVNDRQKTIAGASTCDRRCSPARISAMLIPEIADRYPGTSGSTHGREERDEADRERGEDGRVGGREDHSASKRASSSSSRRRSPSSIARLAAVVGAARGTRRRQRGSSTISSASSPSRDERSARGRRRG